MASSEPVDGQRDWHALALKALGILFVVFIVLVFLVLTGIIAEPETVLENIVRTLSGT